MSGGANRDSTYTNGSRDQDGRNGEQKKNMFTSMLESVASGKRLPEKNLLVLGGTPETQRDLLDSLHSSESRRNFDKHKLPPVANSFALGYTYYDVLDADQDDTLARVSLYLLSQPSDKFSSLVAPLLEPKTISNTALIILLDWATPHLWMRQLSQWINLFRSVTGKLGDGELGEMEETMEAWKTRGRGGGPTNLDGTPSAAATGGDGDSTLPLGPGEWTDPLGLPLTVVCQNSQRMEMLEKNQAWSESDFDTVLQYLRTVLLRHGAALIYTSQNSPSQLPILIHSTLGITSLLKRQPLKHNVIDRDKIVVPPNWDSWGKIRVLGGTFEAEHVSEAWTQDIDKHFASSEPPTIESLEQSRQDAEESVEEIQTDSAVARYNDWCREPDTGGLALVQNAMNKGEEVTVKSENTQEFLENQLKILEALKAKQPERTAYDGSSAVGMETLSKRWQDTHTGGVSDHIGPVQINVGGIQVDADDMVQQINDRKAQPSSDAGEDSTFEVKDLNNNQLDTFFQGLMKKSKPADSPRS